MSMPCIECTHIDKCCAASSLLQSIALEENCYFSHFKCRGRKAAKGYRY